MDTSLAILLGKICQYIYKSSDAGLPGLGSPSAKIFHDVSPLPTSFAGVLRYPDKTVLAFQGTITKQSVQSVKDWLQNFRAVLVPALGLPGLVHAGFADQLKLIYEDLLADLTKGFAPPLYVTGHSQGGAVAALATKALQQSGITVTAAYTFAAPRPGDGAFASSVQTPVYRFEYGDDIVPHVPFHGLSLAPLERIPELRDLIGRISDTLGYVSVGALTYGAGGQPLRVGLSPAEERALQLARVPGLLTARDKLFAHHHMPNYIGMLSGENVVEPGGR